MSLLMSNARETLTKYVLKLKVPTQKSIFIDLKHRILGFFFQIENFSKVKRD